MELVGWFVVFIIFLHSGTMDEPTLIGSDPWDFWYLVPLLGAIWVIGIMRADAIREEAKLLKMQADAENAIRKRRKRLPNLVKSGWNATLAEMRHRKRWAKEWLKNKS